MAEVVLGRQVQPLVYEFETLAELGSLVSLAPQGFSATTTGLLGAAEGYRNYAQGSFLIVRAAATSYLFLVTQGTGTLVALLIGTLSGGSGSALVGAALKYVVYPSTFLVAPSGVYATVTLALAAAASDGNTAAPILVAPGAYTESFTLLNGMQLIGLAEGDTSVAFTGTVSVAAGASVGLRNISVNGGASSALICVNGAGTTTVSASRVRLTTAGADAVTAGGLSDVVFTMRDGTIAAGNINLGSALTCTLTLESTLVAGNVLSKTTASFRACTLAAVTTGVGGVTMNQSSATIVVAGSTTPSSFVGNDVVLSGTLACNKFTGNDVRIGGATSDLATGSSVASGCSFNGIAMTAPADLTLEGCSNRTTGITGTGTITLVGPILGGMPIADTITVTAVSTNGSREIAASTLAVVGPTAWPSNGTDYWSVTSTVPLATGYATLTLPAPNAQPPGREIEVKNVGSTFGVLVTPLSGTIDTGNPFLSPGSYLRFIADRANNQWKQS